MMNDITSDMITRIRNAQRALLTKTEARHSGLNVDILKVLKKLNFIKGYEVDSSGSFKRIYVFLKYVPVGIGRAIPMIGEIKRVSKPGNKIYRKAAEFLKNTNSIKNYIVSTNKGVIDGNEAKKLRVGGEVLCWVA